MTHNCVYDQRFITLPYTYPTFTNPSAYSFSISVYLQMLVLSGWECGHLPSCFWADVDAYSAATASGKSSDRVKTVYSLWGVTDRLGYGQGHWRMAFCPGTSADSMCREVWRLSLLEDLLFSFTCSRFITYLLMHSFTPSFILSVKNPCTCKFIHSLTCVIISIWANVLPH